MKKFGVHFTYIDITCGYPAAPGRTVETIEAKNCWDAVNKIFLCKVAGTTVT